MNKIKLPHFKEIILPLCLLWCVFTCAQKSTKGDTLSGPDSNTDSCAYEIPDSNSIYFLKLEDYKDSLAVYEQQMGKDKVIPDSLKLPFYVALQKYPELHDCRIEIAACEMATTMEARPTVWSTLFKTRKTRTYRIYINNQKGKCKGINLNDLSFNMMVGYFGHELAHLLSYRQASGFKVAMMAANYLTSKGYKRWLERTTDLETIKHGLGYALYEGKKFVTFKAQVPPEYRENSKKNYMSYVEILDSIRTLKN